MLYRGKMNISAGESIDAVPVSSIIEASVSGNPIPDKKKAGAACRQLASPL
jgi:hypothetical protein